MFKIILLMGCLSVLLFSCNKEDFSSMRGASNGQKEAWMDVKKGIAKFRFCFEEYWAVDVSESIKSKVKILKPLYPEKDGFDFAYEITATLPPPVTTAKFQENDQSILKGYEITCNFSFLDQDDFVIWQISTETSPYRITLNHESIDGKLIYRISEDSKGSFQGEMKRLALNSIPENIVKRATKVILCPTIEALVEIKRKKKSTTFDFDLYEDRTQEEDDAQFKTIKP